MSNTLKKLELEFNPFEAAASGAPLGSELVPPPPLAARTCDLLDRHQTGRGVKSIVVVGEYGFGKSCLLQWLHGRVLPERRIKTFYFDNPGVQFYDLANALLRAIGRKDLAKFIWEYAGPYVPTPYQSSLFQQSFEEYLSSPVRGRNQPDLASPLQQAIMQAGITTDDQIAHCHRSDARIGTTSSDSTRPSPLTRGLNPQVAPGSVVVVPNLHILTRAQISAGAATSLPRDKPSRTGGARRGGAPSARSYPTAGSPPAATEHHHWRRSGRQKNRLVPVSDESLKTTSVRGSV